MDDIFFYKNERYTMINEYANVLATSLIASDEPMYYDKRAIDTRNNGAYASINLPGSIMCATFGISELELAKLKDEGKEKFDLYLRNKLPETNTELVLDVFINNINTIYNSFKKGDKENIALSLKNISDSALIIIEARLNLYLKKHSIEVLEKIYFDLYKIQKLLEIVDSQYEIDEDKKVYNFESREKIEEFFDTISIYKSFLDNKELFSDEEKSLIYKSIEYSKTEKYKNLIKKIIKSKLKREYDNKEFNIDNIAKKYYLKSNEPLNDNTKLIEKVRKSFTRTTVKEKLKEIICIEQEENPILPSVTEGLKLIEQSNMRDTIKYKTPIIYEINTEQKKQGISKSNGESMRDM